MISDIVTEILSELTGLETGEIGEIMDVDLFSSGVLDSLSFVSFISMFESKTGKKIVIRDLKPEEVSTIRRVIATLEQKVGQ